MDQKQLTYGEIPAVMQQALGQMYDSREIPSMAYLLASACWGMSKGKMLLQKQEILTDARQAQFYTILQELCLGSPIQYILGNADFFRHQFLVNPNVLIPRPETEELVQWVVDEVRERVGDGEIGGEGEGVRILDIGTGSGCIAISLKLEFPQTEVWALDVSFPALETARHNAEILDADVRFILADILAEHDIVKGKFDLIVSNPPYITTNEKSLMRANVLDYEPEIALFVNEQEPLVFYQAIAAFSRQHLHPGGKLFFEINEAFGPDMIRLMEKCGFTAVELRKDMMGKDRMVCGQLRL